MDPAESSTKYQGVQDSAGSQQNNAGAVGPRVLVVSQVVMLDVARASRGLSVRLEISDSCLQSEKRCEKVHRLD